MHEYSISQSALKKRKIQTTSQKTHGQNHNSLCKSVCRSYWVVVWLSHCLPSCYTLRYPRWLCVYPIVCSGSSSWQGSTYVGIVPWNERTASVFEISISLPVPGYQQAFSTKKKKINKRLLLQACKQLAVDAALAAVGSELHDKIRHQSILLFILPMCLNGREEIGFACIKCERQAVYRLSLSLAVPNGHLTDGHIKMHSTDWRNKGKFWHIGSIIFVPCANTKNVLLCVFITLATDTLWNQTVPCTAAFLFFFDVPSCQRMHFPYLQAAFTFFWNVRPRWIHLPASLRGNLSASGESCRCHVSGRQAGKQHQYRFNKKCIWLCGTRRGFTAFPQGYDPGEEEENT